jgi:adenosylcobinamide-GDP ribazoletransferase
MFQSFWHALAFLTRLPVPKNLQNEAWSRSPSWYPAVGLLLGGVLAALAWGLGLLAAPSLLTAMLVVTAWVYLTGGLHLDGLMDTADGFGSYRSRERVLEIMKDSRVGAMGVLAAILLLGNKVAALAALPSSVAQALGLLLATMLGRTVMLAALYWARYAREDGLAKSLKSVGAAGKTVPFLFAALVLIASAWWLKGALVLVIVLPLLVAFLLIRASYKRIGGCTGDVFGALCELTETAVLIALALGGKFYAG